MKISGSEISALFGEVRHWEWKDTEGNWIPLSAVNEEQVEKNASGKIELGATWIGQVDKKNKIKVYYEYKKEKGKIYLKHPKAKEAGIEFLELRKQALLEKVTMQEISAEKQCTGTLDLFISLVPLGSKLC